MSHGAQSSSTAALDARLTKSPYSRLAGEAHRAWLLQDATRQLQFFSNSLRVDGGFDVLDLAGRPLSGRAQELHVTTRLVHSYALGLALGAPRAEEIIDAGLARLLDGHRDKRYGGYVWSIRGRVPEDQRKLAYGHVFVLLAASSAKMIGHPDADQILMDASDIIDRYFWDESRGLLKDEYDRDWRTLSPYRGMNANMHGVEAFHAAYEATGDQTFLERAERILAFFIGGISPANGDRIIEHYHEDWTIDPDYRGDPIFRPKGTTPGHSFEFARLALQHLELSGSVSETSLSGPRRIIDRAHRDAWRRDGGYVYTLNTTGSADRSERYSWPVTEAIGAFATLLKLAPDPLSRERYTLLWDFAESSLIDRNEGGWFPELSEDGQPASLQFEGKPDIYHSLQATLLPIVPDASRLMTQLLHARQLSLA
jgi:sulfoquinovose isomerase